MKRNGVAIDDTFAEAFAMKATRLLITAADHAWARHAADSMTGFATSVIGCGCEAGLERLLGPEETPDGRPGAAVLMFGVSTAELGRQVERRVAQCVLTCPSTACFAGLEGEERLPVGKGLRWFGDGWQISKLIGTRRLWRVPVMDGEFLCDEATGMTRAAVGGGNLLILAASSAAALGAAQAAVAAMRQVPEVILPFPGGVVRSGSKVGSRYKALTASTNTAYCPTLRGVVDSDLDSRVGSVLEIVIDGLTDAAVRAAMRAGMEAVCAVGEAGGVLRLSAGNYGGRLGQFRYPLREILA